MTDVRAFGAMGDGKTDDTEVLQHAIADGDGALEFGRGDYLIKQTIEIPLDKLGRLMMQGNGGRARILMAGTGPAFRLTGNHTGTGDPTSLQPDVWHRQRMPTILNLEIHGLHPEADGIELVGTMQPTLEGVLIRKVRNGIRLFGRNRNVLISHCHIYYNTGVGILMDQVNLHQINIASCHISYNRLGGIRISDSEIRNLQITGNDIEYNNHRAHKTEPAPTAEIYIDMTGEKASVAEVTICSNTIQATPSPGGSNIRIIGDEKNTWGLITISGNIIGNQENNVHLTRCHGIVLNGNFIYSAEKRSLLVEHSDGITVGSCNFRRHTPTLGTGVRFENSKNCVINGCHFHDESEAGQTSGFSLLELADCRTFNINGCQILDGVPFGVDVLRSSNINLMGCTILDSRETKASQAAVHFAGEGGGSLLMGNTLGAGTKDRLLIEDASGVNVRENI